MIRWVVTGPIGAGKSLVSDYLVRQGAAVVSGDALGHEVLEQSEVIAEIQQEFGAEVVQNGKVDRTRLGALVFGNPAAMENLNRISHARISRLAGQRLDQLAREKKHELAVLEAAMYFLFPSPPAVDLVISVMAAPEIRARRLMADRDLSLEEAQARLAAQTNLEPLWYQADVLVTNESDHDALHHQIDLLLNTYLDRPLHG